MLNTNLVVAENNFEQLFWVAKSCLSGILARIAQAGAHHFTKILRRYPAPAKATAPAPVVNQPAASTSF